MRRCRQRRDLLRPRRHRAQPGLDDGHRHREPRDVHGQHRPRGRRREPAARPEQRAGLAATWARSRTSCRATGTSRTRPCAPSSRRRGACRSWPSRACASRTCSTPRSTGQFKALYVQGEDVAQSDPDTQHVTNALSSLECMIVQDLFLNETAKFAHVFLPGSSFLEKDGTFTNAERRISPRPQGHAAARGPRRLGSHSGALERARLPDELHAPVARSWTRSRGSRRRSPA